MTRRKNGHLRKLTGEDRVKKAAHNERTGRNEKLAIRAARTPKKRGRDGS